MENSYFEVKVSFIHVAVLLVGVILIGSFLFYLGYQAGKSSVKDGERGEVNQTLTKNNKPEEIQLSDARRNSKPKKQTPRKKPSIQDELKMHQLPVENKNTAEDNSGAEPVKSKPIQNEPYFSIQVGAFSDYTNAKKYSSKFANMGYPTEILSTVRGAKKLFRVRVGNFATRSEAKSEMKKLERKEKGKFAIVKSGQG